MDNPRASRNLCGLRCCTVKMNAWKLLTKQETFKIDHSQLNFHMVHFILLWMEFPYHFVILMVVFMRFSCQKPYKFLLKIRTLKTCSIFHGLIAEKWQKPWYFPLKTCVRCRHACDCALTVHLPFFIEWMPKPLPRTWTYYSHVWCVYVRPYCPPFPNSKSICPTLVWEIPTCEGKGIYNNLFLKYFKQHLLLFYIDFVSYLKDTPIIWKATSLKSMVAATCSRFKAFLSLLTRGFELVWPSNAAK